MVWAGQAYEWVKFAAVIAQLGLSVAVLVMVKYELQGLGTIPVNGVPTYTYACYLALPEDWPAACTYGEVVGSLSILATFILSLLQLYITAKANGNSVFRHRSSSKCPKRVLLSQSLLLIFILAFWVAAASVFHIYGQRADTADFPKAAERGIVAACAWSSVALLSLLVIWELFMKTQGHSSSSNSSSSSRVPNAQLQPPPVAMNGFPAASYAVPPAAAVPFAIPAGVQQQYTLQGPHHHHHHHHQQQQQQQQHQQQQHWIGADGVVVGIPLIPIPAMASPQPALPPAARLAGMGPSGVQMAVFSGGHQLGGMRTHIPRRTTHPMMSAPPTAAAAAAAAARRTQSAHIGPPGVSAATMAGGGQQQVGSYHSNGSSGMIRVVNPGPHARRSV